MARSNAKRVPAGCEIRRARNWSRTF